MLKTATAVLALSIPTFHIPSSPSQTQPASPVSTPLAAADTWNIDVTHSELTFSVRHILSKVRGHFTEWNGTLTANPTDWKDAGVDITVQTASITTDNDRRDTHLKSADFFDAEKFPTITFKSTKVTRKDSTVTVNGNLTMHGVTKPIVLTGKFLGMTKRKNGKYEAAFDASTTVNRTDFGMVWNKAVEGGMLVGEDVTIDISVAADQQ